MYFPADNGLLSAPPRAGGAGGAGAGAPWPRLTDSPPLHPGRGSRARAREPGARPPPPPERALERAVQTWRPEGAPAHWPERKCPAGRAAGPRESWAAAYPAPRAPRGRPEGTQGGCPAFAVAAALSALIPLGAASTDRPGPGGRCPSGPSSPASAPPPLLPHPVSPVRGSVGPPPPPGHGDDLRRAAAD